MVYALERLVPRNDGRKPLRQPETSEKNPAESAAPERMVCHGYNTEIRKDGSAMFSVAGIPTP